MKKNIFLITTAVFMLVSAGSVSAATTSSKNATLVIQGGSLDVTVDNNIDFGTVTLNGSNQTKANIGSPIEVAVSDALGDGLGWDVRLNIAPLENTSLVALAGQQYDYTAVGSVVNGTDVTASPNAVGVAPSTDIALINALDTSLSGGITLNPGFLTLTVGSSATADTYTGSATFSVVALP
jgi:hypothetical protein